MSELLRRIYAAVNQSGFLKRPAIQKLFLKSYYLYKEHLEDPYTPLLRHRPYLVKDGHVLDVGANIGYTGRLFAEYLSPARRVVCFEPESQNAAWLREVNADLIRAGRLQVVQAAAGDSTDPMALWINPLHHADHRMMTERFQEAVSAGARRETVRVVTLDEFWRSELGREPVSFIKIDVQGFEEKVVKGMSQVLHENPHAVIGLEYYPAGIRELGLEPQNILPDLREMGYRLYTLTRKEVSGPMEFQDLDRHLPPSGYIDLLFDRTDKISGGNH